MLAFLVFVSGMTVLAAELAASRLLAPYFGTSLIIWANLIGLILLYLTAGYWLGGRLADRYPRRNALYHVTAVAAVFVGLIPFLARPILRWSSVGFATYSVGIFLGSLVGVIALFLIPVTLLGCVSPWAIRLAVQDVKDAGRTSGSLYALSTLGSIAGAYLPVLLLIPTIGTARTFVFFGVVLLLTSLLGLMLERRKAAAGVEVPDERRPAPTWPSGVLLAVYVAALIALVVLAALPPGIVRAQPYGQLLYEGESAYNYIQVVQTGTRTDLILNEGHAVHSIYDPNQLLTQGPWDYFMLAPFFGPHTTERDVQSLLLLGSAAGTTAREYTAVFGPIAIEGVEIDPKIVEIGRRFFHMTEPNLKVITEDARYYLNHTNGHYRVIAVDAYHQPYIPFHLTTKEFFQQVRQHLQPDGVAAINAGRTETDYRLVNVLASTMKEVYPTVFVINIPTAINSIIVGTNQPSTISDFFQNLAQIQNPTLREVAAGAYGNTCVYLLEGEQATPADQAAACPFAQRLGNPVFTDDLAPVEQVIDQIILGYISQSN